MFVDSEIDFRYRRSRHKWIVRICLFLHCGNSSVCMPSMPLYHLRPMILAHRFVLLIGMVSKNLKRLKFLPWICKEKTILRQLNGVNSWFSILPTNNARSISKIVREKLCKFWDSFWPWFGNMRAPQKNSDFFLLMKFNIYHELVPRMKHRQPTKRQRKR